MKSKKVMIICILSVLVTSIFAYDLFINEFMASNDSAYADPFDGEFDDWIEIYNAGTEAVDIGGMYITDDLTDLTVWQIPTTAPDSTTITAGGFLILWADKQSEQGVLHVEIKLSGDGEQIGLTESDTLTVIDSLTFEAQTADISYGRYPDGDDNWEFMLNYTPGSSNVSGNSPPIVTDVAQDPMTPTSADIVNVTANITDDGIIGEVLIKYDNGLRYVDITMYDDGAHGDGASGDDVYGGYIPAQGSGVIVNYYVEAMDNLSTYSAYPEDAPAMTLMYESDYTPPELYINEFMASNETTITDPQGEYDDWIEIYNPGTGAIDIGGMYVTDDFANPSGWWEIPSSYPDSTTIPAGGYLLLWADKQSEQGVLHVEIKLSGDGEEIGLYAYRGSSTIDTIVFGEQYDDVSFGRYPDGDDYWQFMTPTPDAPNVQTSVEDNYSISPSSLTLLGNYPNPFNPTTTISFSLNTDAVEDTELIIYNIKGQKVKTLVNEPLADGQHSVIWNGDDDKGKSVSSGIYFYSLKSGSTSQTKKMILMK